MKNNENKIIEVLNHIRPYLNSDGGDIEYIKYEDDYVYIKFYGACANCGFIDYTINDNILEALREEVPSIKGIIKVDF